MADALDPDDLYEVTRVTELATSPDGERVAFVAREYDAANDERRQSLFVVPADGGAPPRRLSRASDAGSPTWGPAGRKLGFVAARDTDAALQVGPPDDGDDAEDEGDGEPEPQVWVFDLARGGDARQVTDREEGVRDFDFGPAGERVVVDARDPTDDQQAYLEDRREGGPVEVERLQHKANGVGWLDDVTAYLFVVDCETRESHRLDGAYGAGSLEPHLGLQPAWGPHDRIAFLSNRTDEPDDSSVYDVFAVDPDGGNCERLTRGEAYCTGPTWSPDGDRLACVAREPPTNWYRPAEVAVADPAAGSFESVSAGLDRTVAPTGTVDWIDDRDLLAPVGDGGRTRLVRCDAEGGAERVFDAQGEGRSLAAASGSPGGVAVAVTAPDAPSDVFALGADLASSTRLTDLNADLVADGPMPDCERLTVENDAGDDIEALVFRPADFAADGDPRPLVVQVHGGPMAYDAPAFRFDRAYWAAEGYLVACVNYRGSTSYGREFAEALRGTRGELETEDLTSAVDALVDRGWADPDRLFVTGISHGGVVTAHAVTRDDRFAAAAPEHGIYDYHGLYGTDDNHNWLEAEFGLPWEEPETYRDISSLTDVDAVDTPLLITAGDRDWRCPPSQSEQLYVSVRKRGVPAKLVVYQDEHHDISTPERAIHRIETLTDWFETHDPAVEDDDGGDDGGDGGR